MKGRNLLTLALMAGVSTFAVVQAQAAPRQASTPPQVAAPAQDAPPPRFLHRRSQSGLTAAPTDFGTAEISSHGLAAGGETTPLGVNRQELGGGFIIPEEAVKSRSTVTRDGIAKLSPTANPYQMINLLPGVVITGTDNAGLNGGNISIRGFNSDQLGMTIEGAPINDSGNYALFPQEYVDGENIEQVSIAQGAADLDSPHIGATGGVINVYMRDPLKTRGGFVSGSYGSHNLSREFVRLETGQIGDFRGYASFSHYHRNHWVGPGSDERRHTDFKGVWEPGQGNRVTLSVIYNDAVNNFYQQPSLGNFNILGANTAGFNSILPPTFFTGPDKSANQAGLYYKWRINPFRNLIVSAPSSFAVNDRLTYDVIPYLWYGFGNGGGTASPTENTAGTSFWWGRTRLGNADWSGNGAIVNGQRGVFYNPSITETVRPGLINKATINFDAHKLLIGYWFEYANHRQTAPYAFLSPTGDVVDPFLTSDSGPLTPQRRDTLTRTITNMFFVSDSWTLLDDKLTIESGVKVPHIHRTVDNYLPGVTPLVTQNDLAVLPQAGFRYKVWPEHMLIGSVGTSFKATPNFALADSVNNGTGVVTPFNRLKPEQSVTVELGHRYQGEQLATALSIYATHFDNFQQTTNQFFPGATAPQSTTINGGRVELWGISFEAGARPIYNIRPYVSANYLQTRLLDNLSTTGAVPVGSGLPAGSAFPDFLPTKGKHLPRAPMGTAAFGLDYDDGHILANFHAKAISGQQATFTNDEGIRGYLRLDAMIGYRFDDFGVGPVGKVQKPEFRVNFANLTNRHALTGPNSIQATRYATRGVYGNAIAGGTPNYFVSEGFSAIGTFSMGF